MRTTLQVCGQTQVAIEKRGRRAALEADERVLLVEHLPTCAECLAFARTLEQTEKVMQAHAQVLIREVDLTSLGDSARASIKKQKRGMYRGMFGLAFVLSLVVAGYAVTRQTQYFWLGLILVGVAAYAIVGDLARLKLTRLWAEQRPRFDIRAARRERRFALLKLGACAALLFAPGVLPGIVGAITEALVQLGALVGVFHYVFAIRALGREIRFLKD